MNIEEFYNLIEKICPTYHYESDSEKYPRQVYNEYATNYEYASNNVYEKKTSINLTHYSRDEFDKTERNLELVLLINKNITFTKETSFDETNKTIENFYDIEISEEMTEEQIIKELKENGIDV